MFRQKKNEAIKVNSNHTMTWKERTKHNSHQSRLRESLYRSKSSLAKKSMYLITLLPDREKYYIEDYNNPEDQLEIHEWWAENTVDFLNELQLIYGVLSESNEDWRLLCEKAQKTDGLGYPKNVKYLWKPSSESKPKQLPIDVYIDHVMFWVNSQIENEDIFPSEEDIPFPDNFRTHVTKMFKRMFRIFAIIYSNACLFERQDVNNSLEPCFKHFLFFSWKWGLLESKETKCLEHVVAPLKQKFDRDEQLYRTHQLPYDS